MLRFGTILATCASTKPFVASNLQKLAGLMAALVIDYQHTGRSNSFHVKMMDERALQFNDQHVLENCSLAASLELLQDPRLNFLMGSTINVEGIRKVSRRTSG